jgi:23S rRNA (adenine-N6)-dimethyltransferase
VVANLPFARSGAILTRLLRDPSIPLRRAHVIVQWEFAAKHTAVCPATLRGTYWRAWFDVSLARRLDRSAFAPPPSVDAAVVRLERRARPRLPLDSHEEYWTFLRAAFGTQEPIRRSLRHSLSPLEIKRLAPALGFGREARAWKLDAEQWARLFAFARRLEIS